MNKTVIAIAASVIATSTSLASIYRPPGTPGYRNPNLYPGTSILDNSNYTVTINAPLAQTLGVWGAIREWLTGARDLGDWFCAVCSVDPNGGVSLDPQWASFITSVVNPSMNGPTGAWRLGDTLAICDGSGTCIILTFTGYSTDPWRPDPSKKMTKSDKGQYKNQSDSYPNTNVPMNRVGTPLYNSTGYVSLWLLTSQNFGASAGTLVVVPGPLIPLNSGPNVPLPGVNGTTDPGNFGIDGQGGWPGYDFGGGGWTASGGGGCVHVDSYLPNGQRAGDVKVGDILELADETSASLDSVLGTVTYSERKFVNGFRITTSDGTTLVCSDTAPLWTDTGYAMASDLLGRRVATRVDSEDGVVTKYKLVEVVEPVGSIFVQHITVGNRAFWAGERQGAYLLHHNDKYVTGGVE